MKPADSSLLLVLNECPGYPPPGAEVRCRIVIAVWEDGRVIRKASSGRGEVIYVEGALSPGQMNKLRTAVDCDRLRRAAENGMVLLDAPEERLYVRCGESMLELIASSPPAGDATVIQPLKDELLSLSLASTRPAQEPPASLLQSPHATSRPE